MACPACGAETAEGARFCSFCGHELMQRAEERRVATLLFADLVGFTTLSERLDPEQVKRLADRCFDLLTAEIREYGGVVDKIVGDAIVALFGAPTAHEDDPERAVRAALAMQRMLASSQLGAEVKLRVGVNTGEVVVGALAGGGYTAMGDVVNTAERLESAAPPGGVLVGPDTYAATRDSIRYQDMGLLEAKGRVAPVHAWLAEEAIQPPGRRTRSQTPLVGREAELGMLQHAVQAAMDHRRAHLVLLIGEAGVGKTRLASEIAARVADTQDALVLEGRCVPYGEANVWWPVAEALRTAIGIEMEADATEARDAVSAAVSAALSSDGTSGTAEIERVAGGLLHLLGHRGPLGSIEPQRAREEATRAVLAFVEATAALRPVVFVLSDLHWADDVVLDLIDSLMDRCGRQPLVLLATARQELTERWSARGGRHNQVVINLDPLDPEATATLLDRLAGRHLPREVRKLLLDRSGGNPLFLEELVALVGQSEAAGGLAAAGIASAGDLPETLRGLVAARVDALSLAQRRVLEDAAVWGRHGKLEVIQRMAEAAGRAPIDGAVTALVEKEILVVEGGSWAFRSDLVREVAYGTLTKTDRARTHCGIACQLEMMGRDPATATDQLVDLVAHHFATAAELATELGGVPGLPADLADRALVWVQEAATRAARNHLLPVSVRMFSLALRLLPTDSDPRRVELLLGRAKALAESRRLSEAAADVDAVERLVEGSGVAAARATYVRGEISLHEGELERALEIFSEAAEGFASAGDRQGEADARRSIGLAQIYRGDNLAADAALSRALEISRELGDRQGEAWAQQQMAWISFVQGRTAEADERLASASRTFEELGDRRGLAWVKGMLGYVRFQQGRLAEAGKLADEVLAEARESGDRWAEGMMQLLAASVRLWSGEAAEALPRAEEALALFREIGDQFGEMQSLAVLGRTLVMLGRVVDGFRSLEAGASVQLLRGDDPAGRVSQTATASTAVQVGDHQRALSSLGEMDLHSIDMDFIVDVDRIITYGLALLQSGDVAAAVSALELAATETEDVIPSAYGASALALAYAASGGAGEVARLSAQVEAMERATYLDRFTAQLASVLVSAAQLRSGEGSSDDAKVTEGDGSPQSVEHTQALEELVSFADRTDDQVSQALARLARAQVLEAWGSPEAAAARREAETRLGDLGVHAGGWRQVFALVLDGEVRESAGAV